MEYHPSSDLYALLGVTARASAAQIKAAHRDRIRAVHPDAGGDHDAAAQLNHARDVLLDPDQRAAYNRSRRAAKARVRRQAAKQRRHTTKRRRRTVPQAITTFDFGIVELVQDMFDALAATFWD